LFSFTIIAEVLLAFLITYLAAPPLIKKLKERKITGIDIHKPEKPVCAEMGGLLVLLGVTGAFCFAYLMEGFRNYALLGAFLTIVFVGLTGVVDDFLALRQRYKPLLVALASTPLILASVNHVDYIWFPFFGELHFGYFYLLLVPLGVATASNLTNMLAGFNGLEAGVGAITCGGLGILSVILGEWDSALLAFPMFGASVAFLRYNWYPAQVFPGDTGTLISGATIACTSILGHFEIAAILMLVPAAVDFTLKMVARSPFAQRKVYGDTLVLGDGTLIPPRYPALCHAFMKVSKIKERDLVLALLLMEVFYTALGILLTLLFK